MSALNFANKENIIRVPKTPPGHKVKALKNKNINLYNNENVLGVGKKLNFKASPLKSQNLNINQLEGKKLFNKDIKKINGAKSSRVPLGGKDKNKATSNYQPLNTKQNQKNSKIFVQKDKVADGNNFKFPGASRRKIRAREPLNLKNLNKRLNLAALSDEETEIEKEVTVLPEKEFKFSLDLDDIEIVPAKQPELAYIPTDYTPLDEYDFEIFSKPNCLIRTKENEYEYDEVLQNEEKLQFKEIDEIEFTYGELEEDVLTRSKSSTSSTKEGYESNRRFMNPTFSSVNRSRSHTSSSNRSLDFSNTIVKVASNNKEIHEEENNVISEKAYPITEDKGLTANELESLLDF